MGYVLKALEFDSIGTVEQGSCAAYISGRGGEEVTVRQQANKAMI